MEVRLTVIVPVYNEEESLLRFREEMDKFLEVSPVNSQVLFVNDGSDDGSLDIIKSIALMDNRYGYISLAENGGLSTALKAGIDSATTPLIGYIDSDLQTSPLDFLSFFDHLDKYAMVNGIRANRQDSLVKKISSKIANSFRRAVINDGIADTCCPLKIIHTSFAKSIPFFKGMHRFLPGLVLLQGGKVKQLEVGHFERYAGTAKYHLFNRLVGPFVDTIAFLWMRNRTIRYEISDSTQFFKSQDVFYSLDSKDE